MSVEANVAHSAPKSPDEALSIPDEPDGWVVSRVWPIFLVMLNSKGTHSSYYRTVRYSVCSFLVALETFLDCP